MTGTFRFAGFELDLAAYVLRAQGEAVRLEKIPMEALILLVQRAGTLVERSDIAAAVWGACLYLVYLKHMSVLQILDPVLQKLVYK